MSLKFWSAIFLFFCFSSTCFALTLSGASVSGGNLILVGEDFPSKLVAAPLIYDTFENGLVGATLSSIGVWQSDNGNNAHYANGGYGGTGLAAFNDAGTGAIYNTEFGTNWQARCTFLMCGMEIRHKIKCAMLTT